MNGIDFNTNFCKITPKVDQNVAKWKEIHLQLSIDNIPLLRASLMSQDTELSEKVNMLQLPSLRVILQDAPVCDFAGMHQKRNEYKIAIARALEKELFDLEISLGEQADIDSVQLRSLCASYLILSNPYWDQITNQICCHSKIPVEKKAALATLINFGSSYANYHLESLFKKSKTVGELYKNCFLPLVQAENLTVEEFKEIIANKKFTHLVEDNPMYLENACLEFINNLGCYHDEKGQGYEFIAETMDAHFKNKSAVLKAKAFEDFTRLIPLQKELMRNQFENYGILDLVALE